MKNLVGVMQGRLLPKYKGRYQAHPVGYWQNEFAIAASLGLDLIEFVIDDEGIDTNPLMTDEGIKVVRNISEQTGVAVKSICADCFMNMPLHSADSAVAARSESYLKKIIVQSAKLSIGDIVIPCVDQSSLKSAEDFERLVSVLQANISLAEANGVNLSLETDLAPDAFCKLLDRFESKRITVNYDTGNSAAMGYSPKEEFEAYGNRISDIHIKDRKKGGSSAPLGTGDTDFDAVFECLSGIDYTGPFIMQAYRDDEGVEIFKEQLSWLLPRLGRGVQ